MVEYTFSVDGVAEPKGNKSAIIRKEFDAATGTTKDRAVLIEGRRKRRKDGSYSTGQQRARIWFTRVTAAARFFMQFNRRQMAEDQALALDVTFYLPRPPSLPKRIIYPMRKPDLDKLTRAIGDSLKGIVYDEDSRIVDLNTRKRFAAGEGDTPDGKPRAVITVRTL